MTMNELKMHYLVQFTKKTGRIRVSMGGRGTGLLRLWALQNTTSKHWETVIFDDDGWVRWDYEGTGEFPIINNIEVGDIHIDEYCEGLLESCAKAFKKAEKEYEDGLQGKDS